MALSYMNGMGQWVFMQKKECCNLTSYTMIRWVPCVSEPTDRPGRLLTDSFIVPIFRVQLHNDRVIAVRRLQKEDPSGRRCKSIYRSWALHLCRRVASYCHLQRLSHNDVAEQHGTVWRPGVSNYMAICG